MDCYYRGKFERFTNSYVGLHCLHERYVCFSRRPLTDTLSYEQSIFTETFATRWDHWLVAKLLSGMGVGMLQSTIPLYLSEIAPTQLKGFFINAYSL